MKFKPENYGISSDYKHWVGDKTEDYIGPFFFLIDGSTPRTAFRIQEHNLNAHDSVHGGVLMAFADYTLCMGANMGQSCLLYTSPSPRDLSTSRMPSSA